MARDTTSQDSIMEATRNRAEFSRYGGKGAAGFIHPEDSDHEAGFLSKPGETAVINPHPGGFEDFTIGVAWDIVQKQTRSTGFLSRWLGPRVKTVKKAVDLDLGCLYQLEDGRVGALQAFGESFGSLQEPPYIALSGDERTGEKDGHDEILTVSGAHWGAIRRMLIYVYIYAGAENWDAIRPQVQVRVPGETPIVATLRARREEMVLCAVASLENIRGGIRMTNTMEYYPGHPSMDRAFGYGLQWDDGAKQP